MQRPQGSTWKQHAAFHSQLLRQGPKTWGP